MLGAGWTDLSDVLDEGSGSAHQKLIVGLEPEPVQGVHAVTTQEFVSTHFRVEEPVVAHGVEGAGHGTLRAESGAEIPRGCRFPCGTRPTSSHLFDGPRQEKLGRIDPAELR
jgi:hypothetical protein